MLNHERGAHPFVDHLVRRCTRYSRVASRPTKTDRPPSNTKQPQPPRPEAVKSLTLLVLHNTPSDLLADP